MPHLATWLHLLGKVDALNRRGIQKESISIPILAKTLKRLTIDENTAILVSGNNFEVIGQHYVLVYDGTFWNQKTGQYEPGDRVFHVLGKGRKYDMGKRVVVHRSRN